jgi:hypothetical protein
VLKRRLILLVPLLAMFAFVATTEERAEAADVATRVEGEDFGVQPSGTKVVTDTTYYSPPNYQALKFTNDTAIAEETVTFDSEGDVVLWVRGGQPNGSPTLRVKVDNGEFSPYQTIINNKTPIAYTFHLNVSPGDHIIKVNAGNTGTERYPFVDFVTFPASGNGGTDPDGDRDDDGEPDSTDNCPNVYNPGQRDDDKDGVGNKCEFGPTTPTDTDGDGVQDTLDNCPNDSNPNQNDGDGDRVGNLCDPAPDDPNIPNGNPDTDGDGVPDSTDQCHNQPGPASNNGCPVSGPTGPTFPAVDRTVNVTCSNMASTINNDPETTQTDFKLPGQQCNTSTRIEPRDGDILSGPTGTITNLPVKGTDPSVSAIINNSGNLDQVIRPRGSFYMRWVQVQGGNFNGTSGSGVGIAMGEAADDSIVYASRFTQNEGAGVSNAHGKFYDVEADNNGSQASLTFIAAGIKALATTEFIRGYYHDNTGNGLWCDQLCVQGNASLFPNGFWVHDIAAEGNVGGGIRYENATSEGLIEDNFVYGNATGLNRGGISVRDAQNLIVEGNTFNGAGYPHNQAPDNVAVIASDSGRSNRPNLQNITVRNNDLNEEEIRDCDEPVVTCTNNTDVGTR